MARAKKAMINQWYVLITHKVRCTWVTCHCDRSSHVNADAAVDAGETIGASVGKAVAHNNNGFSSAAKTRIVDVFVVQRKCFLVDFL